MTSNPHDPVARETGGPRELRVRAPDEMERAHQIRARRARRRLAERREEPPRTLVLFGPVWLLGELFQLIRDIMRQVRERD